MNSYAEAFAATIVSTPEEIERRLQIQMRMGVSRIDATIIDEAFREATREAVTAVGRVLDSLSPDLIGAALNYIVRGVSVNMQELEAQCVMQSLEVALAQGIPIKVASATTPGCDCPVCTAARQAEPTRH